MHTRRPATLFEPHKPLESLFKLSNRGQIFLNLDKCQKSADKDTETSVSSLSGGLFFFLKILTESRLANSRRIFQKKRRLFEFRFSRRILPNIRWIWMNFTFFEYSKEWKNTLRKNEFFEYSIHFYASNIRRIYFSQNIFSGKKTSNIRWLEYSTNFEPIFSF